MSRLGLASTVLCLLGVCAAQDIRVPNSAVAGEEASISTTGSGKARLYLFGPGIARKADVDLGEEIRLKSNDLHGAGEYVAVICSGECPSASFPPASLARPGDPE
jgi:hypothetical protein